MKKIYISHRGNVNGVNSALENTIPYIESAILQGFDCEIDLWKIGTDYFLGHDKPQHKISTEFLFTHSASLWIHCKNFEALSDLSTKAALNIFWHQQDSFTLTSKGYIWTFPGINIPKYYKKVITVLFSDTPVSDSFGGYCSDNIQHIKELHDKINSI